MICDTLLQEVIRRGSQDNLSVVLIILNGISDLEQRTKKMEGTAQELVSDLPNVSPVLQEEARDITIVNESEIQLQSIVNRQLSFSAL